MLTGRTPRGGPRGEEAAIKPPHPMPGRLIDRVSRFLSSRALQSATPKVTVTAQPAALDVTVDLGWMAPERVGVTLSGRTLRIEGASPEENAEEGTHSPRISRTLSLPFAPRPESVSGSFRNGKLNLRIPRPSPIAQNVWKKMPQPDVIKGA